MRPARPLIRFACIFALAYGALIAPWPRWNALYGGYFRAFNGAVLSSEGPGRIVRFQASPPGSTLDTEIVVAAAGQDSAGGKVKALRLMLDSRGVGWIPTALIVSLVVATQVPWARRLWALLAGTVLVHVFIILTSAAYIWDETLAPIGPGASAAARLGHWVADGLVETFVVQLGASFVVPAVIWLLVTFNRGDLEAAQRLLGTGDGQPP